MAEEVGRQVGEFEAFIQKTLPRELE